MVNNGSKPLSALFFKLDFEYILGSNLLPFWLNFPYFWHPRAPKGALFRVLSARARTFAHSARAGAILREFGAQGRSKSYSAVRAGPLLGHGKTACGTSGRCSRVGFSTFCAFRGVYRLQATDLSQLPFLRCGFSNSFTGSVQEAIVQ